MTRLCKRQKTSYNPRISLKGSFKGRYFEKMMKKKTVIAAILFFVLALPAFAETKTWTGGGTDNKWSTGENWSGGAVPGAGDNAPAGDRKSVV